MNQTNDLPTGESPDDQTDKDMAEADRANGELSPDNDATNDTEARYGEDESPA